MVPSGQASSVTGLSEDKSQPKLHLLLPASNRDINLCKLLLSAHVHGYPTPTLIAWNEVFTENYLLGAGSHVAKISKVLEHLKNMPKEADDDLVLMMDAFDIWFQLKPEVLISRYLGMNEAADYRNSKRLGKAAKAEDLRQKIVFGAGKRCAPNQAHTIACYPIPESPVPNDIYGGNTDTIVGRNRYTSQRQRYLNSGYIIGPVKDMRKMFEAAWEMVQAWPNPDPNDNGSHGSDFMYHGSDQSVFAVMFGQQEYQRQVMRRRYSSWHDISPARDHTSVNSIEGTVIGDDVLNPPFTHEKMEHFGDRSHEYGIGLDYFSDLGHQTVNAEFDGRFVTYNAELEEIKKQVDKGRNEFDCEYRGYGYLPDDILETDVFDTDAKLNSSISGLGWKDLPLYTNLCMARIPVMIHHNGDKGAREHSWRKVWFQPFAEKIIRSSQENEANLGAYTDSEGFLTWDNLCPADYSTELFRAQDL